MNCKVPGDYFTLLKFVRPTKTFIVNTYHFEDVTVFVYILCEEFHTLTMHHIGCSVRERSPPPLLKIPTHTPPLMILTRPPPHLLNILTPPPPPREQDAARSQSRLDAAAHITKETRKREEPSSVAQAQNREKQRLKNAGSHQQGVG